MKSPTIGILAGMGPRSTAPFLNLVINACQNIYGAVHDVDFPTIMICSQPAPFYEDRPVDHVTLETATLSGLRRLVDSGADFLAIACNTVHIYYERLAQAVDVPLLNIVDLSVAALPDSSQRIALIAARPTIESGIYQQALQRTHHEVVELDWQRAVDELLAEVKNGVNAERIQRLWTDLEKQARQAKVSALIVACLDLSESCLQLETSLLLVDSARCLADVIVKSWIDLERNNDLLFRK